MIKLIIPAELPNLNQEINKAKIHWASYAKFKKKYTSLVSTYSKQQTEGLQLISGPHKYTFNWFSKNKKIDPDNIAFAKKYIFDGLQEAGIIENDGWNQVSGWEEFFYIDKDNPRVEIYII